MKIRLQLKLIAAAFVLASAAAVVAIMFWVIVFRSSTQADQQWGIYVDPNSDVISVQVRPDIDRAEQRKRVQQKMKAYPDRDLVFEPPPRVLPSDEQRRIDGEQHAQAVEEAQEFVRKGIEEGRYEDGPLPACQENGLESGSLPMHCNGKLVFPEQDGEQAAKLARLDPEKMLESVTDELNEVLQGVDADRRELGFDSAFKGSAFVEGVRVDEGTLRVDFSQELREELEGAHSYRWGLATESLMATLFRYPQVDSIVFEVAGACDLFSGEPDGSCTTHSRNEWEATR